MNSSKFKDWTSDNAKKLIEIRRWLHQNPEIGFDEYKTSEYLKKIL